MGLIIALLSGLLFGMGLVISGMTNADKVQNFLDVAGHWDPSLALVMGGALLVAMPGVLWLKKTAVVYCQLFTQQLPTKTGLDLRLITGAAVFGLGWGLAGYCPGPILAGIGLLNSDSLVFVPALFAGYFAADLIVKRLDA